MDFCTIIVEGHLTRDPELSYTQSNKALCRFSIACNGWKKGDANDVSFFDVVAWEKTAQNVAQFLHKGSHCIVEGRLKQDRFVDKATGQNRSKVQIIAANVKFLDGKSAGGQGALAQQAQASATGKAEEQPFDFPDYSQQGESEVPF